MSQEPPIIDFLGQMKTKKPRKRNFYEEHQICKQFWNLMLDYKALGLFKRDFEIFHVANEHNSHGGLSGSRLKEIGKVAGVPDYCVVYEGFSGFIEFKTPKTPSKPEGKLIQSQKDFFKRLDTLNVPHVVVRSAREGLDVLIGWMGSNETHRDK